MFPLIFLFKRLQASFEKNMQEEKHPLWAFLTESLFENMLFFFSLGPLSSHLPRPLPPFSLCSYGEHVQVPALPSHFLQGLQMQRGRSGEAWYLLWFTASPDFSSRCFTSSPGTWLSPAPTPGGPRATRGAKSRGDF